MAFKRALRCYLLSGFPVLLPVDFGRMQGYPSRARLEEDYLLTIRNICQENALTPDPRWICQPNQEYPHAILLVGCAEDPVSSEFLFHDPARFPFMKGSAEFLFEASAYVRGAKVPMSEIASGTFVPIVPGRIKMPLTNWLPSERSKASGDGIMQLADLLQNGLTTFPTVAPDCAIRLTPLKEKMIDRLLQSAIPVHPDVRSKVLEIVRKRWETKGDPSWVWLQWDATSAWLWNAELPGLLTHANDAAEAQTYLQCAAWKTSRGINAWSSVDTTEESDLGSSDAEAAQQHSTPNDVPGDGLATDHAFTSDGKPELRLAILSSYALSGIAEMLKHWPLGRSYCEFYGLTQSDAEFLLADKSFDNRVRKAQWAPDHLFARFQNAIYRPWRPRIGYYAFQAPTPHSGMLGWLRAGRRMWVRKKPLPKLALGQPFVSAAERMAEACDRDDLIERSEERRVGKECRSRWSPYH